MAFGIHAADRNFLDAILSACKGWQFLLFLSRSRLHLRLFQAEVEGRALQDDAEAQASVKELEKLLQEWRDMNAKELCQLNSTAAQSPLRAKRAPSADLKLPEEESADSENKREKSKPGKLLRQGSTRSVDGDLFDSNFVSEGPKSGRNALKPAPKSNPGGSNAIIQLLEPNLTDFFGMQADKLLVGKILEAEGLATLWQCWGHNHHTHCYSNLLLP